MLDGEIDCAEAYVLEYPVALDGEAEYTEDHVLASLVA